MRYYDKAGNRLVYVQQEATPDFWDEQWEGYRGRLEGLRTVRRTFVSDVTQRYLQPEDGPILEGGCGYGMQVAALAANGYRCTGIDWAARTVEAVQAAMPELDVRRGDIRRLDFADGSFAGYWSLGVIEHFWEGYEPIGREAARVLRPGGYLFLTFPYLSPLRRLNARRGVYPPLPGGRPLGFYQFALDAAAVAQRFAGWGFAQRAQQPLAGLNGAKDDLPLGRGALRRLYHYRGRNLAVRGLRFGLERCFLPVAAHSTLLVLRRQGAGA